MIIIFFFYFFLLFSNVISSDAIFNKKIEKFLLENPEIILKSIENYRVSQKNSEQSQINKIIKSQEIQIFKVIGGMYSGNYNSAQKIVVFFDYNCGYCKKAYSEIKNILKKSDFMVIYRQLPLLSDESMKLAKLSLSVALNYEEKFLKFHEFLYFESPDLEEAKLKSFFDKEKIDYNKVKNFSNNIEISEIINSDIELAKKLKISGTPAFIIKNEVITGWMGKNIFESLINN